MSNPSPLVFELCTAIDRFHEQVPDLSVSEVLAALAEVSMALRGSMLAERHAALRRQAPETPPRSEFLELSDPTGAFQADWRGRRPK